MNHAATNARPADNVTPSRVIAWTDVLGAGKEISVLSVSIAEDFPWIRKGFQYMTNILVYCLNNQSKYLSHRTVSIFCKETIDGL